MNPSTKKLCLFGLATGLADTLLRQSDDDVLLWRARKLKEAGEYCLDKSNIKVDKSKLKQVEKKIDQVYLDKEQFDTVEYLAFLLCGLDDLSQYLDAAYLDVLIRRTQWCLEYFDSKLDKTDLYLTADKKYKEWVK